MSSNRYIVDDEHCCSGTGFNKIPAGLGINAVSISQTIRSRIPSKKSKYDRSAKIDEFYREWRLSPDEPSSRRYEKVLFFFYELYKPRIAAIAKKYRTLSPVFDDDDLQQTALLGIFQALIKYNHAPHIKMKFSTFLEWSIRNIFQRAIGYADKFVEIYNRNNELLNIMSYQDFLSEKKIVESAGHVYIIRSKQCYLGDIFRSEDAVLDAAATDETTPRSSREYGDTSGETGRANEHYGDGPTGIGMETDINEVPGD